MSRVWSPLPLVERYLLRELLSPFWFGVGLFTCLALAIDSLFELIRAMGSGKLVLFQALQVLLYKFPGFLALGLPMGTLLAALLTYGELNGRSELIALRSLGLRPQRLLGAVLLLGLFASGLTFSLNNFVVPHAAPRALELLEGAGLRASANFQEKNIIYPEYKTQNLPQGGSREILKMLFYAERFDGRTMYNLTIFDRSQREESLIINAQQGYWDEALQRWQLQKGSLYQVTATGVYGGIQQFQNQSFALPKTPLELATTCQEFQEMSFWKTRRCLRDLALSRKDKRIRRLEVYFQERFAFPLVCVLFGLLGGLLGMQPTHQGRALGFSLCIILIVAYYIFSFLSSSLGIAGTWQPWFAAWLPNLVMLGAGGLVLGRLR